MSELRTEDVSSDARPHAGADPRSACSPDHGLPPSKAPGFRFSGTDAIAILVGIGATALLWRPAGQLALLPLVVLGHFFLFCNIFRIRRAGELTWAGCFIVNVGAWVMAGHFTWGRVLLAQIPLTLLLVVSELFSPRYHGAGYTWIKRRQSATKPGTPR